ncbi:MAG: vitamin K epoxide reductase family protein [Nannocystaceae bacterium]
MSATSSPSRRLPTVLALLALLLSIGLEAIHVRAYLDPSVASFCAFDAKLDCDSVALSRSSIFLGIPVAIWGFAGFWAILSAIRGAWGLFLPLTAVAAAATTGLLVVELAVIGSLCVFCEAVHLLSLALLWIAWRRRDLEATRAILRRPVELLSASIVPIGLLVIARLFTPPYWALASWVEGLELAQGVDEEGHPWVGATSPTITVHEYVDYGCPHCAVAAGRMRVRVTDDPESLRVVRHHYPRMRCVGRVAVAERCTPARAAVCAGAQGRFWEMDSWLFLHAPGVAMIDADEGARAVGLDLQAFQRCMKDPAIYERVDAEVKAAGLVKIRETPAYIVDGQRMTPQEVAKLLGERL